MRDQRAPVINGHDFSGLTNRYSFQCEPYYEEGGNGGTFLDGSTVKDVLAVKERLSWTMNSLTAEQYAAMCAAFNAGETPDLSVVVFTDPAINAVRKAAFHVVTRPPFLFSKEEPYYCTKAGAALVLEESYPIERYAVTPPTRTDYAPGDSFKFALTGMSVSAINAADEPTDITSQCVVEPPDGSRAGSVGTVHVCVSYGGVELGAFSVTVAAPAASGDGWTLYDSGTLRVFFEGDMPDRPAWENYKSDITNVEIRDGVTSIGDYAFNGCSALISVTIPDSVASIGDYAFNGCSALSNVAIPDSVTAIKSGTFNGCSSLISVTIPDSVSEISDRTFRGCSSLISVTIPDSVTYISFEAFMGCLSLTSITIPDSVAHIGYDTFRSCPALSNVAIPDGIATIDIGTFAYCTSLRNVTIPESVTNIRYNAFNGCDALSDVYYSGTQAQWETIDIESGNDALLNATIHYNSGQS